MKIFKKCLLALSVGLLVAIFSFAAYFFAVTANIHLQDEKLASNGAYIQIYDQDDEVLTDASAEISNVTYQQLPKHLIHAFLATEDRRFFSHNGFDFLRIGKALVKNIATMSMKEGASTISQQLIKNTHLTGEKTIKRKLQEVKLTSQLERKYSKEDIFLKYLNTIYFGHNVFGICEAARFYFDCDVENLSIDESAILAGLVRSPNNYSPFKHPEKCKNRRDLVLGFMKKEGYLDETSYQTAKSAPIPTQKSSSNQDTSYSQFVYNEAEGILENLGLEMGGQLHVYTYMNRDAQNHLSAALSGVESNKSGGILDNNSGGFLAFYSDVGNILRSPASTLKPLAVYAPAMEEGLISPASPIFDEPINFSGYQPKNYDGKFHGYVSARESLQKSLNVPAVKALNTLGIEKSKKYLEKMQLLLDKEDEHLALALGGIAKGFSLAQLLSAYSVFPNEGIYSGGVFIRKIERDGRTIYQHTPESTRVFDKTTAYLTTDILKGATKTGTAKKLKDLPFPIAAKTGTAGTAQKNTDAYAIAYTSGYTGGIWLGNADNSPILYTGGGLPCSILKNTFEYLCNNSTTDKFVNFSKPEEIEEVELDLFSYNSEHQLKLADPLSPPEYVFTELFKKGESPTQRSDFFSFPSIPAPHITYKNLKATISFDNRHPTIYQYKIDKLVDGKTRTIYFGERVSEFFDDDLSKNKTYIYAITPYFNNHAGKTIFLPAITTKEENSHPLKGPEITEKPWWQY